ncbi:MAG: cytochrome c oxidase subunit II, partial [Planctomycetota bacterium]
GGLDMSKAPEDALTYQVTARQWNWNIVHPPGESSLDARDNVFWVPKGTNVLMTTRSEDVLHSFYIPAFRVKRDVLPGRYQTVWFRATKIGTYPFFCTEYCGTGHSAMLGTVHVISKTDFEKRPWRKLPDDPIEAGAIFYEKCKACHSNDGKRLVGPTFRDLYGREEIVIENGTEKTITVDDDYIIKSLREPNAQVVKGFDPTMTPFSEADLSKEHLEKYLIPYLKSISKHTKDEEPK